MSDYGASITLTKKDKSPVSDEEKAFINSELNRIKTTADFSDAGGEPLLFQVNTIANEKTIVQLVFSEYWRGEGDTKDNFEFAKENDLVQVEEIAALLSSSLGPSFNVKPEFENW